MNIFISNISFKVREDSLTELFSQYGEVISVRIIKDKDLNFSEFGYEYYKTITEEDQPKLSSYLSGDQINLSIISGIKKYFHIFVNEIKSKEELREDKLENILE